MQMRTTQAAICLVTSLILIPAATLHGQSALPATAWDVATEFPQVDFSGLSAFQKKAALKLLREEPCTCQCAMKLAQCRVQDPNCGDSRTLAAMVIKEVREGKKPEQVRAHLANSDLARQRSSASRVLGDPVDINIAGSPVKGPANARLTLVEFSDFQ